MFDLAIIIVGLQLFFFTLLIMKEKDFHTSKNNNILGVNYRMLHVKQPDIVSSIWLEMKPPSVNELTVHLHNVQKNWHSWKANIGLSFNFMNNILPIQDNSCL